MRKLITLLLAAGMAWSLAAPSVAAAVDVKFSGAMDFTFERRNAAYDKSQVNSNSFDALQRLRVGMEFIASESLSAYYMLQVGTGMWGSSAKNSKYGQDFSGGHQSIAGQSRISTRYMYMDWIVPNTSAKVRMGKQDINLPGYAFDLNPVQNGIQPGIVVNAPITDIVDVTAYWMRPSANERGVYDNSTNRYRNMDVFALAAPMNFEGFNFSPYFQVASIGNHTNSYNNVNGNYQHSLGLSRMDMASSEFNILPRGKSFAWWAGFASKLTMFDPFTVAFDFAYGSLNGNGYRDAQNNSGRWLTLTNGSQQYLSYSKLGSTSGWLAALRLDYTTAYGVPTLLGWYASGDGKGSGRGGRMPYTTDDQASSVAVASTYFDYAWSLGGGIAAANITGTWGISLGWNKFSFMEDLFHDFTVTYVQGTNNKANVYSVNNPANPYTTNMPFYGADAIGSGYLTTKDSLVDVNLISSYAIYKNLAANLELGYMFQNFDRNLRATYTGNEITSRPKFQNIWRTAVNFKYVF